MTLTQLLDALDHAATYAEAHHTVVLTAAGILLVALTAAGWWTRRRLSRTADAFGRFCDAAAVAVAVALSAEGMWEAATEALHLAPYQALLLFAFAELSMLRAARRARTKVGAGKRPGVYGQIVWGVALAAGLIATTNAPNLTEHMIRLGAPLLVAWQWWADLADALRERTAGKPQQRSSWIWTPRYIGIQLGLIRAGEQDLVQVDHNRRIHRLTVTAHRLHHGSRWLARWRRARLRRLALQADDAMVTEARIRVARVDRIERLTHPDAAPVDRVDDATRDVLDEVRLITRQATERLRAENRVASRNATQGETWSNALVRMPRRVAERIGDAGVTHSGDAPDAPVRPAMTHPDAPADDADDARPVSAPPGSRSDAEREAAIASAMARVLTKGVAVREAARGAAVSEATLRRRIKARTAATAGAST